MLDGADTVSHLRAAVRRNPHSAEARKSLDDVTPGPIPPGAASAVAAFETLSATRSGGVAGPRPLTISDVQSYSTMLCPLTERDVRLVLAMDAVYLKEVPHG